MTRRLPVVLVILGAVIIIASVIAAALVRSTDTVTLALPERPDETVVVTEPGVLSAVDQTVTIRAVGESDEPVMLAVGRTAEVEAWLDGAEHVRVVGLSSWEELSVEVSTGSPAASPEAEAGAEDATEEPTAAGLPNPAGSDLWVTEAVGTGETELSWTDRPGRWSLVAATDGSGPAPMVELEWGREVGTPWLVPGVVIGVLLLLVGGTMLVLDGLARREQRRRDDARERQAVAWTPVGTGPVATNPLASADGDAGSGERLSRRQIRELERSVAQAERRRGRADDAPPIPFAGDDAIATEAPAEEPSSAVTTDDAGDHATDHTAPAPVSDEDDVAAPPSATPVTDATELSTDDAAELSADDAAELSDEVPAADDAHEPSTDQASLTSDDGDVAAAVPSAPAASHLAADQGQPDEPAIPADGSTPRPVAAAPVPPRGPRGWRARRRAAADQQDDGSPAEPTAIVPVETATVPAEPALTPSAEPEPEPEPEPATVPGAEPGRASEPAAEPAAQDEPAEQDEPDDEAVTPSWRSVWGFGATPAPRADRSIDRHDDQGEEAR